MVRDAFEGFPAGTFRFLKGLSANNNKAWFDEHRADYDACFVTPARDFVAAIGPRLQKISPEIQFEPRINGSVFRINRDVRFSKDKTPYKDHLDIWFWHGARTGWDAPGFYLRLTPTRLILGAGMHRMQGEVLHAYRAAVVDDGSGKALEKVLAKAAAAGPYGFGEPTRKGVPRGYDKDHPRAALLLQDGLFASLDVKLPAEVKGAGFVTYCTGHYKALQPLNAWLMEHVATGASG